VTQGRKNCLYAKKKNKNSLLTFIKRQSKCFIFSNFLTVFSRRTEIPLVQVSHSWKSDNSMFLYLLSLRFYIYKKKKAMLLF